MQQLGTAAERIAKFSRYVGNQSVRRAREIGTAIDGQIGLAKSAGEVSLRNPRLHLAIAGCLGWLEFLLAHVAEYWHWLPWFGWGLGHGLDLFCAIGGTALLLAALFVRRPETMADDHIDPEQVCRDIDAVAERAESTNPDDANIRGDCISQARECITRFIRDLDATGNAENWDTPEKINRIIDLDDLLNASIDPTLSNEAQIYRVARQALPRHRR